jgi:hypothetical protein
MFGWAGTDMTTREHQQKVEQVLALARRLKLSLEDLTEIGGQDLKSSSPKLKEKARRVAKCWALMAQLGVKHFDLPGDWQPSPASLPGLKRPRRRGEGVFLQPADITGKFYSPQTVNSSMKSMGADLGKSEAKSAEKPGAA